ncbi:hypothetical protein, partial [Deinococcus geothermalis]|uniref:hypothetical protein n=1 Tax=Deinococcus geothermalis TaxID=68909 RepID=UPI002356A489
PLLTPRETMKLLALLALVLSTAQAAPILYTVTVKLNPSTAKGTLFIISKGKISGKEYACHSSDTSSLTCKLPKGSYDLSIYPPTRDFSLFDSVKKIINVRGNISITQIVKVKPPAPEMPTAVQRAFNSIAISTNGETEDCKVTSMTRLCVRSPLDIQVVKSLISLNPQVQQVDAWAKAGDLLLGGFDANGVAFQIILSSTGDGGTFMQFIRG